MATAKRAWMKLFQKLVSYSTASFCGWDAPVETSAVTGLSAFGGPQAGALNVRVLPGSPAHRHRKQPAAQHGLLNLPGDFDMVLRPRQVERLWEVRVAEEAEVLTCPLATVNVDDGRQVADVPAAQ